MSPLLWILLLVAVAAAGAYVWRSRSPAAPPPPTSLPPSDDLGSLGLSTVRPAQTARPAPMPAASRAEPAASLPSTRTSPISNVSEARPRTRPPDDAYVRDDSPLWPDGADAVRPLLRSLAVSLGGGAAVLRYDGTEYIVDALVGVPGVRSPRPLPAGNRPLHRVPQDTVLSILGPESRRSLSYYADPDAAVGQAVTRALAAPPARRVLLVADVPPGQGDLDDDALALVARYGDLLAALTDLVEDPADLAEDLNVDAADDPVLDEAASEDDLSADPGALSSDESGLDAMSNPDSDEADAAPAESEDVLPRVVVLQRAMDAARDAERALAFALVTPTDADAILRGEPEDVARAEAALRARLDGSPVRTVEPFGDLMLGIFLDADADTARTWAGDLAQTEPPLLIGLVESAEGDPDAVRAAATAALEEAYHQGGGLAVAPS